MAKGNCGNLLQHWTLCEALGNLQNVVRSDATLAYLDTYAMAPRTRLRERPTDEFRRVERMVFERRVPGVYSRAWAALGAGSGTYPSSALFVCHLWPTPVQMALAESNPEATDTIAGHDWGRHHLSLLHGGDWRRGAAWHDAARRGDVTYAQLDPNGVSPKDSGPDPNMLYQGDLSDFARCLPADRPVTLHVNSYPTQGSHTAKERLGATRRTLSDLGYEEIAVVCAPGRSAYWALVAARGFPEGAQAELSGLAGTLNQAFGRWLGSTGRSPPCGGPA